LIKEIKGNNEIVTVDHNILIWARRRLNLDINEVAHKLKKKPSIISSWENGKSRPSLSQLETLAYEIYKIPLATFFLPEPPDEPQINHSSGPFLILRLLSFLTNSWY
jgi:transcriptional regulator with XRE-family HTH domain